MDGKVLARIGAIVFVAIAITATAIEMARKDESARAAPASTAPLAADPLREGLRRCQLMGEAAVSDPACMAVWDETRNRFLGRDGGER